MLLLMSYEAALHFKKEVNFNEEKRTKFFQLNGVKSWVGKKTRFSSKGTLARLYHMYWKQKWHKDGL